MHTLHHVRTNHAPMRPNAPTHVPTRQTAGRRCISTRWYACIGTCIGALIRALAIRALAHWYVHWPYVHWRPLQGGDALRALARALSAGRDPLHAALRHACEADPDHRERSGSGLRASTSSRVRVRVRVRVDPGTGAYQPVVGHLGIGALAHWRIGGIGALAHWRIGALGHWRIGALAHWDIGALAHWGIGLGGSWGSWCIWGIVALGCWEVTALRLHSSIPAMP